MALIGRAAGYDKTTIDTSDDHKARQAVTDAEQASFEQWCKDRLEASIKAKPDPVVV